ncbi:MAG TPA: DUF1648 domain-containing protein [Candidatus Mediterraneibacter stercoripullorum]|nr:DUF1648 domain-containing protein [Candidatus Mediterraneibacter stercoripullorum]
MKTKPSKTDRILEALGWIMLIGTLMYLIIGWSSFPDQIPAHYNAAGEIDRYGSKWEIVFIEAVMWLLYLGIGLLEKYPEIWNTGVKVTPANREKVYCTLRYFIKTLKLSTTLIFAFLVITSLQGSHLPGWFTPASLFLVFGGMAFWLIRLFLIRKG